MDKIARIRQEIERLKSTNPSEYNYQNAEGYIWALDDLLSFLDTLSKESDKSLEEEYMDYVVNDPDYSKLVNRIAGLGIARHFAEWQKEQDMKMLEANWGEGFRRGKAIQKEQMLKDAIPFYEILKAVPSFERENTRIIIVKGEE